MPCSKPERRTARCVLQRPTRRLHYPHLLYSDRAASFVPPLPYLMHFIDDYRRAQLSSTLIFAVYYWQVALVGNLRFVTFSSDYEAINISCMVRVPKMRHRGFFFFSRPTGLLQRSDNVM